MKYIFVCCLYILAFTVSAQEVGDRIFLQNINGILFCPSDKSMGFPVTSLGKSGGLQLQFDDLLPGTKAYSYTYQLCDAEWVPVNMSPFDYLSGFTQNRITSFTRSSISTVKYNHYSISLPESNFMPVKSGNYLLKVFLNGDTSQLAFTRRFLILDDKVSVSASVQQPFNAAKIQTHQKVQVSIDVSQLSIQNPPQQVKVVVLQNYRWDNSVRHILPSFMRGDVYEYNGERDLLFPAGKEYRWVNNTSFRFFSDRVRNIDRETFPFQVFLFPDRERTDVTYMPYQDYNGFYYYGATEDINVSTQGDYGRVYFNYFTKDTSELSGQDIYLVGQFNNYVCDDQSRMQYDAKKNSYTNAQLLKQGYYTYIYVTRPKEDQRAAIDASQTEGNYWQTENDYTVLVYYRNLNNRYDELVAAKTVNSRDNQN